MVENVQTIADSPIAEEYAAFSTVTAGEREMRFARNPIADRSLQETPAPALGEHTDAILRELGHDDDTIVALRAAQVIG